MWVAPDLGLSSFPSQIHVLTINVTRNLLKAREIGFSTTQPAKSAP